MRRVRSSLGGCPPGRSSLLALGALDLWDPADGRGRDTPGRHLAAVGCRRSHARCLAGRASGGFFGLPAGLPRGGQTPIFLLLVPARALVVGASGKFGVTKRNTGKLCTFYLSPSPAIIFLYAIYTHQSTDDEYPLYSPCTRPLSRSPADTRLAHTQLCAIFKRAKAPFALALSTTVELRALLQQIALALPLCLPTGACTAAPAPVAASMR